MTDRPEPVSWSDRFAAIGTARLGVEIVEHVTARTRVDLVAFFAALAPVEQHLYWDLDVTETGMEHEWERPLAYLTQTFALEEPAVSAARATVLHDLPSTEVEAWVRSRDGQRPGPGLGTWTESDHETLMRYVPWTRPRAADGSDEEKAIDALRVPGPLDVPLWEEAV